MSDSSTFDLARASNWFGVLPGMTRPQVIEIFEKQGVETDSYGDDHLVASTEDWEIEMYFATDGSERLRQVAIDGDHLRWNGEPVQDARLDDVLRAMEPVGPAMWEAKDASDEPFAETDDEPETKVSDEELLDEATLWIAQRRLGLVVMGGDVICVVWREPRDFPRRFAGELTEAQRELSRRKDLDDHLAKTRSEKYVAFIPKDPLAPWRKLLTLLLIASLVAVARLGIKETQMWNQAQTITAKLIAIEQVRMKGLRDYVPGALRWVIPPGKAVMVEGYRVEFFDPHQRRQEAVLERGELYVPPHEIGAEVPVAYVDSDPPRTMGLSRARDAAFIQYVPWVIALAAIYGVALAVLQLVPKLWRLRNRFAGTTRPV